MADVLDVHGPKRWLGTISLEGDRLVGSTPMLQAIANSWMNRFGSAQAAFPNMDGWFNGYVRMTAREPNKLAVAPAPESVMP